MMMLIRYRISAVPKIAILLAAVLVCVSVERAYAQTVTTLSPNSDLVCINPVSGKNSIAKKTANGLSRTTFKKATKEASKKISRERDKSKVINQLVKKLEKKKREGLTSFNLSPKEFNTVKSFIFDGDPSAALPPNINEQISILQGRLPDFAANMAFQQELIKLIKSCEKNKLPAIGELALIFEPIFIRPIPDRPGASGSGSVAMYAVVPRGTLNPSFNRICYSHKTGSQSYAVPSNTPCEFVSDWPGACDRLISKTDKNGVPDSTLALIDSREFTWNPLEGPRCSFEECSARAEGVLRARWGESLKFAVVKSFEECEEIKRRGGLE